MTRTDRLLAIVMELQGKGRQRAEDLAETFETSKRTIYRDIQALCEAGVPLVATPGRGYSLMEGYFLPPLSFSADEAAMLLLGSDYMAQNFDQQYHAAAESASRKIAGVLPEKQRAEVRALRGSLHFIAPRSPARANEQAKLQVLQRALTEQHTVHFQYQRRHEPEGATTATARDADPYALTHLGSAWYLTAYCHLRRDVRFFRLDRMDELAVLDQVFTRPADLTRHLSGPRERGTLIVRALFASAVARWVQEAPSYFLVAQEETPAGWLVTLHVRHERDVLQWLLSWGRHVQVLEPPSLRRLVAAEAEALWRAHQGAQSPHA
jgi:predicted DNA-binding transcriptional regulator YafY